MLVFQSIPCTYPRLAQIWPTASSPINVNTVDSTSTPYEDRGGLINHRCPVPHTLSRRIFASHKREEYLLFGEHRGSVKCPSPIVNLSLQTPSFSPLPADSRDSDQTTKDNLAYLPLSLLKRSNPPVSAPPGIVPSSSMNRSALSSHAGVTITVNLEES